MNFEKWALGLLASGIIGTVGFASMRLDKIEEQVTQIRVDVAVLKARETLAARAP